MIYKQRLMSWVMTDANFTNSNESPVPGFQDADTAHSLWRKAKRAIVASQHNAGYRETIKDITHVELVQATDYMITAWINDNFNIVVTCNAPPMYTNHQPGDIVG